jgi:hypothetical protein
VAGLARQLDELKRQNAVLAAGACAPAKAEGHSGQNEGALQRAAEASRAAPPELRNLSALRTTEEMTAAAAALEAEVRVSSHVFALPRSAHSATADRSAPVCVTLIVRASPWRRSWRPCATAARW